MSRPRPAPVVAAVVALALAALGSVPPVAALPDGGGVAAAPARPDPRLPSYRTTKRAGRDALRDLLRETGASSASLAMVDRGRIVWRETFGRIDAAGRRPDRDTMFGLGSVSKVLAAVAVMQLVDAGRVSLDAPVVEYVPDFTMASPAHRQITVRMLLNHTAGLPGSDYRNALTTAPNPGYDAQLLADLRQERLKAAPGSLATYCNDCVTLAGIVVARVSGLPYAQYVRDRIFAPLRMRHSAFPTRLFADGTWAPVIGDDGPLPQEVLNMLASGGAWSTPSDMARLATMLADGGVFRGRRVLSQASVAQMGRDQVVGTLAPASRDPYRFGLGWDTVVEPGLAAVRVTGWNKGGDSTQYHATMTVAPDQDLSVVIQAAGQTIGSGALSWVAQEILLNALVERGVLSALPEAISPSGPRRDRPDRREVRRLTGVWMRSGAPLRAVARDDRSVVLQAYEDGDWVRHSGPFTHRRDGRWWSGPTSLRVAPDWGRRYLVQRAPTGFGHYATDTTLGASLGDGVSLPSWAAREGSVWLYTNEGSDSVFWDYGPGFTLEAIRGLPGYLFVTYPGSMSTVDAGADAALAPMFIVSPTFSGRDLNDLAVVEASGEPWLRFGSVVVRPLDTVPALGPGAGAVAIPDVAAAEWRRLPDGGTVTVGGSGSWRLYDESLTVRHVGDAADRRVDAPPGSYLLVFGGGGSSVPVTVG